MRPVPHAERLDAGPGGLTVHRGGDDRGSRTRLLHSETSVTMTTEPGFSGFADNEHAMDEESFDAGGPSVCHTALPAANVARSRSHSMELSSSRDGRARSVSTSQKAVSRTRSIAHQIEEPTDRHGIRLLTGWEFWILFIILSLREYYVFTCIQFFCKRRYADDFIVSGTGLMCETIEFITNDLSDANESHSY